MSLKHGRYTCRNHVCVHVIVKSSAKVYCCALCIVLCMYTIMATLIILGVQFKLCLQLLHICLVQYFMGCRLSRNYYKNVYLSQNTEVPVYRDCHSILPINSVLKTTYVKTKLHAK